MITTLLVILLYALVALLVLTLCFWIVGLFIQVPERITKIVYAIVGVLFLIWIVQLLLGSGTVHFPSLR